MNAFRRSAAGRRAVATSDIRPLDVLEKCVEHLMECTKLHPSLRCGSLAVLARRFAFVSDRFRAIRAEMTLQALFEADTKSADTVARRVVSILETMIEFRRPSTAKSWLGATLTRRVCTDAHAHDELMECNVEAFDPKQNDYMLWDCFGSLIPLCESCDFNLCCCC